MSIKSKSILSSLVCYTLVILFMTLTKIKFLHTDRIHEPLAINYIGELNSKKKLDNNSSRSYTRIINNTTIDNKQTSKANNSSLNHEQNLLSKEFAAKLPIVEKANENTIQVVNEKALYKKPANKATSKDPNINFSSQQNGNSSNNKNDTNLKSSSFNIEGRILLKAPSIDDKSSQTGIVAVAITVDNNGNVIDAKAGAEGTTIPSLELWNKCEQASLQAKYNAIKKADAYQVGIIRFRFITY